MSEETIDEQGPEHQTATGQATLDLPGITGLNNPDPWTAVSPGGQPTANEVCQAGYTPPSLAQAHETLTNPAPTTGPTPVAVRQRISLPLHPRRGGEIHLSEEAAQLAMSPARVGGTSRPISSGDHFDAAMLKKFADQMKASSVLYETMMKKEGLK